MRDIKFRAWNNDKNIMVYDNEDDSADYWDGRYGSEVDMVNSIFNEPWITPPYDFMQYTGLKDKNGVEIYEGDLLVDTNDSEEIGKVIFDEGGFRVQWEGIVEDLFENSNFYEVIGNIYENSELLEGRKVI